MNIYELKTGERAKITKINLTGGGAARLNSLGVTAGKYVTVLSYSLFKSSILIGCGAVRVGIRKSLATLIEVDKCA